jgi:hypothetical protein
MNEKSEPDSDVLKLTQKFVNFKTDIKRSIDLYHLFWIILFIENKYFLMNLRLLL